MVTKPGAVVPLLGCMLLTVTLCYSIFSVLKSLTQLHIKLHVYVVQIGNVSNFYCAVHAQMQHDAFILKLRTRLMMLSVWALHHHVNGVVCSTNSQPE